MSGRNTGAPAGSGRSPRPSSQANSGCIGRHEPVPDLLDLVGGDPAAGEFGERDLGEARRRADPQRAGDQLQQREPDGDVGRVEPVRDHGGQLGLGRGQQGLHHLGHGWRARHWCAAPARSARRSRRGRPRSRATSRTARGRCAPRRAARIRPGLAASNTSSSGQRGEAEAAVGVRLGGEVAAQQGDLGQAARREDQPLQQLGERDHAARSPPRPHPPRSRSGAARARRCRAWRPRGSAPPRARA